jgi:hypothetical protein
VLKLNISSPLDKLSAAVRSGAKKIQELAPPPSRAGKAAESEHKRVMREMLGRPAPGTAALREFEGNASRAMEDSL